MKKLAYGPQALLFPTKTSWQHPTCYYHSWLPLLSGASARWTASNALNERSSFTSQHQDCLMRISAEGAETLSLDSLMSGTPLISATQQSSKNWYRYSRRAWFHPRIIPETACSHSEQASYMQSHQGVSELLLNGTSAQNRLFMWSGMESNFVGMLTSESVYKLTPYRQQQKPLCSWWWLWMDTSQAPQPMVFLVTHGSTILQFECGQRFGSIALTGVSKCKKMFSAL